MKHKFKLLLLFLLCLTGCHHLRMPGYAIHGIDVSRYQGEVNWKQVQQDSIDFVFVKATEGRELVDPLFKDNWKALEKSALYRGAYHFFLPSVNPYDQVDNFVNTVKKLKAGDLPPVLDIEKTQGVEKEVIQRRLKIWLQKVEEKLKVKPIIYTGRSFYEDYLKGSLDEYVIWIAHYTWRTPILGDQSWSFWQYTDRGKVRGIKGYVDLNVFEGSRKDLEKLCIGNRTAKLTAKAEKQIEKTSKYQLAFFD